VEVTDNDNITNALAYYYTGVEGFIAQAPGYSSYSRDDNKINWSYILANDEASTETRCHTYIGKV
jgi:hypothetical protein